MPDSEASNPAPAAGQSQDVAEPVERADDGAGEPATDRAGAPPTEGPRELAGGSRRRLLWGFGLVVLCLVAYLLIKLPQAHYNYIHFVAQAQAWFDGNTAIPTPGVQDAMPLGLLPDGSRCTPGADAPSCVATGYSVIPFPPLPAWVLMAFVAIWHEATNEQLLATIFAAFDVGIAFWMLGYLRVSHEVRVLTSLFLGLGTVLWYTAAIGTTWFWAHIVAVGCLLISLGLALSADRSATEPQPLGDAAAGLRILFRPRSWPGGWLALAVFLALGAAGGLLLVLAGRGASPATLALAGLAMGLVAVVLAVVVAGRPAVLAPFAIAVAVVGGLPALLFATSWGTAAVAAIDALLLAFVVAVWWLGGRQSERVDRWLVSLGAALSSPEALQVGAGILFGLAVTARLTILFGFPFFLLVGGGGNWLRRGLLAGAGATVPLVALLVYTYAATGDLFNPAYQYQYVVELKAYGGALNYNPAWSIADIRYIPQNLGIMLFGGPRILPDFASVYPGNGGTPLCVASAARGLFDASCPLAIPEATGTSLLLSSPAFLIAPLAWRPLRNLRLDRVTVGASVAVVAIAIVNLMHFSQGWVQFGYRFSNDFVPFALLLVALGAGRIGKLWPVVLLVALSILVNFWGTTWGVILGW